MWHVSAEAANGVQVGVRLARVCPPTCAASASGMSQKCTDSGAPSGSARRRLRYIASAGRAGDDGARVSVWACGCVCVWRGEMRGGARRWRAVTTWPLLLFPQAELPME